MNILFIQHAGEPHDLVEALKAANTAHPDQIQEGTLVESQGGPIRLGGICLELTVRGDLEKVTETLRSRGIRVIPEQISGGDLTVSFGELLAGEA